MWDGIDRRGFLRGTMAGGALLTVPGGIMGCARSPAAAVAAANTAVPVDPFSAWYGIDAATVRRVMAELTSRGADAADLYFQYRRSNSINMEDGIVSHASTTVDQGVGLRVVVGDQTGYAFTEELTEEAMLAAARTAAAIASAGAAIPPIDLTTAARGGLYTLQVPWSDVPIGDKLPILRKVDTMARAKDAAVEKVRVSWTDEEERVVVVDLAGNVTIDERPMTRLWCSLTARKGEQTQSNAANVAGRQGVSWYTDDRLTTLVDQAVARTMVLFEARRPPAGELPVVLAACASGILLHEAIGHGMEADFNRKGTSIYADMIGRSVAPEFVTIVDDGTLPGERGALNVDDEGTRTERTVLVDKGVLASYLHDGISARHYGVPSTGSGRRQSFRHVVMPRMRCTYMEDGPHSYDEIVASVDNGIVAETFTNGQVQIGAGDFTFYIKNGWLIEGGKITAPIKDVNIIGNGPEALKRVTMVAQDGHLDTGGWTCGKDGQSVPVSQGMPSVLVSSLTVGGVDA
ncbi:MAG: TldD protein [Myxococcota bacterium]|jgi:TldD protein